MRTNLAIPAIIILFLLSGCNHTKQENEGIKPEQDSVSVITKPFKNAPNVIEFEIPVLKGTSIKHGIQKRYYQHGSLYSEIPYSNGKRNGVSVTYYPVIQDAKPVVWKEQYYQNDTLQGTCKRFHKNGKLQAEYEYKNGLPATGLKEYYQSGNPVKLPDLILNKTRTPESFYISARLSNGSKKVDYFIGDLIEGKYLPGNLKGLQVVNGVGEILVPLSTKKVTITAVYSTDYDNSCIVSKELEF